MLWIDTTEVRKAAFGCIQSTGKFKFMYHYVLVVLEENSAFLARGLLSRRVCWWESLARPRQTNAAIGLGVSVHRAPCRLSAAHRPIIPLWEVKGSKQGLFRLRNQRVELFGYNHKRIDSVIQLPSGAMKSPKRTHTQLPVSLPTNILTCDERIKISLRIPLVIASPCGKCRR